MATIRRIYLHLVAFISLETVLWGLINLLRAALDTTRVGGTVDQLAGALAFLSVGLPVFLLHWWLIQRRLPVDPDERESGLRAVFLYGVLLALVIPAAQNVLALITRFCADLFSVGFGAGLVGLDQTWLDNGIAIIMNGLLLLYFLSVIRKDWEAGTPKGDAPPREPLPSLENLILGRRVYRYLWLIYALGLTVFGVQQLLAYLLLLPEQNTVQLRILLANGVALTALGVPLWVPAWRSIGQSLASADEQRSLFRLLLLYGFVLAGMIGALAGLGQTVYHLFRWLLGELGGFMPFLSAAASSLSMGIPFAGLWAYHAAVLRRDTEAVPPAARRELVRQMFNYFVAFVGLMVAFGGLQALAGFVIDLLLDETGGGVLGANRLAGALASLLIGLPLWLRPWLRIVQAAHAAGEAGDRARRTVMRKITLYLALFIGLVGLMISAGDLVFQLLRTLLGGTAQNPGYEIAQTTKGTVLFAGLLFYHWQVLRRDQRLAETALAQKQSLFPVLVIDPGDEAFAAPIVNAIRLETPEVPVAVHFAGAGAPGDDLSNAGAVILPFGVAANPSEALRIWLQGYTGTRLVVPLPRAGWILVDSPDAPLAKLARAVARLVRTLAEGDEVRPGARLSPWVVAAAIFGGLVALFIVFNLMVWFLGF